MRSSILSFRNRLLSLLLLFLVNRSNVVSAQTACADCAACLASSITHVLISSNVNATDFHQCTTINEVTFANTVTDISDFCFRKASALSKINFSGTFSSGLTIGVEAFYETALTGALVLPAGLTIIKAKPFGGLTLLTSVTIPDSVTSIGDAAFDGATALNTVTFSGTFSSGLTIGFNAFSDTALTGDLVLPAGLTSIGFYAFSRVSLLTSVTIPDTVTFIDDSAFALATSLDTVTFSGTFGSLVIGNSAFHKTALVGALVLPAGLTRIGDFAFRDIEFLTSVTIPDSVTFIGDYAFYLSGLTTVTFAGTFSALTIELGAFLSTSLTGPLILPAGLTNIGKNAFNGLTLLTDVTIPDSVITIGDTAFQGSGPSGGSCLIWDSSITRTIGTDAFVPNYIEDCSSDVPTTVPTVVPSSVPTVVESAEDDDLTTGEFAGIVIGVIVAFLLILSCTWLVLKPQRNHSPVVETHNNNNNNDIAAPVSPYELLKGDTTVLEV